MQKIHPTIDQFIRRIVSPRETCSCVALAGREAKLKLFSVPPLSSEEFVPELDFELAVVGGGAIGPWTTKGVFLFTPLPLGEGGRGLSLVAIS